MKSSKLLVLSSLVLATSAFIYGFTGPCTNPRLSNQTVGNSSANCVADGIGWRADSCPDSSVVTPGGCGTDAADHECVTELDAYTRHSWDPNGSWYLSLASCEANGCQDNSFPDETINGYTGNTICYEPGPTAGGTGGGPGGP